MIFIFGWARKLDAYKLPNFVLPTFGLKTKSFYDWILNKRFVKLVIGRNLVTFSDMANYIH